MRDITLQQCAALAIEVGERIWRELQVPVYLYEAAARRPDRVNLENIRRGGFEKLRELVRSEPDRRPDIGGPELHPTAGATVVGARKFLVAFNINLNTPDVAIAREIARKIRTSNGGLPCVKAMGVRLESRNLAQVSMNLTDFEQTPVDAVFAAVRDLAAAYAGSGGGFERDHRTDSARGAREFGRVVADCREISPQAAFRNANFPGLCWVSILGILRRHR